MHGRMSPRTSRAISTPTGARLAPHLRRRRDQAFEPHGDRGTVRSRARAVRRPARRRPVRDRGAYRSAPRCPAASATFRLPATASVDCSTENIGTVKDSVIVKDAAWNERQVVLANPRLAKDAVKLLAKPTM